MKRAIIKITPEFLGYFCKSTPVGETFDVVGVPVEAEFIAARYVFEKNCFHVCFEHVDFEDVPEGVSMPVLDQPVIRKRINK